MLVVKVELWPGGSQARKKDIAQMVIANRSELADESDYEVWAEETASKFNNSYLYKLHPVRDLTGKSSTWVKNHNRYNSIWKLIEKAIGSLESGQVRN